nr:hypothetical protein [Tanacetum cinerariifolium]
MLGSTKFFICIKHLVFFFKLHGSINSKANSCKIKRINTNNNPIKVSNGEFIIVTVYGDDLLVTGTSLDCINGFKRRMVSQFKMSDLGELTYYLGIEVSQGKDYVEIKQERYAMNILKEASMKDCNVTLCPMKLGLKLSKAEDEPEVKATL